MPHDNVVSLRAKLKRWRHAYRHGRGDGRRCQRQQNQTACKQAQAGYMATASPK
jgi:hypothetical protein